VTMDAASVLSTSPCGVADDARFDNDVEAELGDMDCGVVMPLFAVWLLRPSSLAVRAETLDSILPRADEVSEEVRTLLLESKRLGVSSDLTEE
jgi:hypothetical protein